MNVHIIYYEIDCILMLISAKYFNLSYYDIFKGYLYIMYRFLITYTEDHCLYDEYSSIIKTKQKKTIQYNYVSNVMHKL